MDDINVLSKQILERVKKEGQSKLDEQQQKADQEIEKARQNLKSKELQEKEVIELELTNHYDRHIQTITNQERIQLLAKKQALLNNVFEEAVIEIEKWDEDQFANLLAGVLSEMDENKELILVIAERSTALFETEQVKAVLNDFPFVKLSDRVVKNRAGFILEQGGIDYNFTFDALIDELKKEFSPQLATLAFQNNE